MMTFVGVTSGLCLLLLRYVGYFLTGDLFYLTYGYTSLNLVLLSVILGLRQLFSERSLDTGIPFITGNLLIPYNVSLVFSPNLF